MLNVICEKMPDGSVKVTSEATKELFCNIPAWHSAKPDYRHKRITLNCYRWNIIWKR